MTTIRFAIAGRYEPTRVYYFSRNRNRNAMYLMSNNDFMTEIVFNRADLDFCRKDLKYTVRKGSKPVSVETIDRRG